MHIGFGLKERSHNGTYIVIKNQIDAGLKDCPLDFLQTFLTCLSWSMLNRLRFLRFSLHEFSRSTSLKTNEIQELPIISDLDREWSELDCRPEGCFSRWISKIARQILFSFVICIF